MRTPQPEPAKNQSEDARELDVPESHRSRLDEGQQEVEAEQHDRATDGARSTTPGVVGDGRKDEQGQDHEVRRERQYVWKALGIDVDGREGDAHRLRPRDRPARQRLVSGATRPAPKTNAVSSSIAGIATRDRAVAARHSPRSSSQLRTGRLSYQAISCPHSGQRERGLTTDSPLGTR